MQLFLGQTAHTRVIKAPNAELHATINLSQPLQHAAGSDMAVSVPGYCEQQRVASSPATPFNAPGMRHEPPVSEQKPTGAALAASKAPVPPLLPVHTTAHACHACKFACIRT